MRSSNSNHDLSATFRSGTRRPSTLAHSTPLRSHDSTILKGSCNVFGVSLSSLGVSDVPSFLQCILDELENREGALVKGIFSESGNYREIAEIQDAMNFEIILQDVLERSSVYSIADSLKNYLRALPEPLVSDACREQLRAVLEFYSDSETVILSDTPDTVNEIAMLYLRSSFAILPAVNLEVLMAILGFLRTVSSANDESRMNNHNLSIIFASILFGLPQADNRTDYIKENNISITLVKFLLDHFENYQHNYCSEYPIIAKEADRLIRVCGVKIAKGDLLYFFNREDTKFTYFRRNHTITKLSSEEYNTVLEPYLTVIPLVPDLDSVEFAPVPNLVADRCNSERNTERGKYITKKRKTISLSAILPFKSSSQ